MVGHGRKRLNNGLGETMLLEQYGGKGRGLNEGTREG